MNIVTTRIIKRLESNFSQYLQHFDHDRDGNLSKQELLTAVIQSSRGYIDSYNASNMVNQIFQLVDKNKDDRISIDDVRQNYSYNHQPIADITVVLPQNGASFAHWPRDTYLQWQPFPLASSYLVQVEYEIFGSWCQFLNQCCTDTTNFQFRFVGPFRGRWRVTALDTEGQAIAKSEWWIFNYSRITEKPEQPREKLITKPLRYRW